jgi:hypothetical protein
MQDRDCLRSSLTPGQAAHPQHGGTLRLGNARTVIRDSLEVLHTVDRDNSAAIDPGRSAGDGQQMLAVRRCIALSLQNCGPGLGVGYTQEMA